MLQLAGIDAGGRQCVAFFNQVSLELASGG